uniref:Uncharacterized protein n=1 Tax=Rhizophora mucronata TaxID=61149 RepID=A0A2P2KUA4_RHIMU
MGIILTTQAITEDRSNHWLILDSKVCGPIHKRRTTPNKKGERREAISKFVVLFLCTDRQILQFQMALEVAGTASIKRIINARIRGLRFFFPENIIEIIFVKYKGKFCSQVKLVEDTFGIHITVLPFFHDFPVQS